MSMDRSLNTKEQDKVRAARANYFQQQKRKHSPGGHQVDLPTISHPQPDKITQDHSEPVESTGMSSTKRFKFPGMTSTAPSKSASQAPLIVRFYDPDVQARDAHDRTQEKILSWPDSQLERCHNYIQMLFPVPEGSAFNWEAPIIDRETMDDFRSRSELRDRLRLSFERMLTFYGFEIKQQPKKDEEKQEVKEDNVKPGEETVDSTEKNDERVDADPPKATLESTTEEASKYKEPEPADTTTTDIVDTTPASIEVVRNSHWSKSFNGWAVRFDHNHLRITRILRCLRILGLQAECDGFYAALKQVYEDPAFKISERSMNYWTRAVTRPLYIAPDDERIEWLKEWEFEQVALKKREEEGKGESKEAEQKTGGE